MNTLWAGIPIAIILVVALVFIVIEGRIMSKPDSERTDRERKFLATDRAGARGYQRYGRSVAPFIGVASGVLLLLLSIPFWIQGEVGLALFVAAFGVVAIVAMLALRRFVVRRRGPEWRKRQDELNKEADTAGRPRWFSNVKAGFGLALVFFVLGVVSIAVDLSGSHPRVPWSGIALAACGVIFLVLVAIQRRAEQKKP